MFPLLDPLLFRRDAAAPFSALLPWIPPRAFSHMASGATRHPSSPLVVTVDAAACGSGFRPPGRGLSAAQGLVRRVGPGPAVIHAHKSPPHTSFCLLLSPPPEETGSTHKYTHTYSPTFSSPPLRAPLRRTPFLFNSRPWAQPGATCPSIRGCQCKMPPNPL